MDVVGNNATLKELADAIQRGIEVMETLSKGILDELITKAKNDNVEITLHIYPNDEMEITVNPAIGYSSFNMSGMSESKIINLYNMLATEKERNLDE